MGLLRFLVFDRKYSCLLDVSGDAEGGDYRPGTGTRGPQAGNPAPRGPPSRAVHRGLADDMAGLSLDEGKADARLVIGACYSLHTLMARLGPSGPTPGFAWDCPPHYRLLYYCTPTGWKFVALVSEDIQWGVMREWYEQVFVPGAVRSPLIRNYASGGISLDALKGLEGMTRAFFK